MKSIIEYIYQSPIIVAGPCSAESRIQVIRTASELNELGIKIFRAGVWKPRTHPGGFEGYGEKALPWLKEVSERFGMFTATEVGTPRHVEAAIKAGIDLLWIGARTTACPFMAQEIAEALRGTDVPVFIKNPSSADIELWLGTFKRFAECGVTHLGAILRGFKSFIQPDNVIPPYRNTPFWDMAEKFRIEYPQIPILCDPSHIGGARCHIMTLSKEALIRKYDGLIIESHYAPDMALTDANQQITPAELGHILSEIGIQQQKSDHNISHCRVPA